MCDKLVNKLSIHFQICKRFVHSTNSFMHLVRLIQKTGSVRLQHRAHNLSSYEFLVGLRQTRGETTVIFKMVKTNKNVDR
jgi:hypothetical protein